ncbi:hypothetical protein MY5147_008360 [Beauveria neobassiana]
MGLIKRGRVCSNISASLPKFRDVFGSLFSKPVRKPLRRVCVE